MMNGDTESSATGRRILLAGLLMFSLLTPEMASAQSVPALAPYPFNPGLKPLDTKVSFPCNVSGAKLHIDGVFRGVLPLNYDLFLSVGKHSVLIEAKGHHALDTTINVPAIVHMRYHVRLHPTNQEATPEQVKSSSNAWVVAPLLGGLTLIGIVVIVVIASVGSDFSGF